MKLIHLSDLHLGKRVNGFSMLDEQTYILAKIIEIVKAEAPDAVLIAGDIYDKSVPPAEAVQLFDSFLVRLSKCNTKTFVISGNHDSAERIAFGEKLLQQSGVYMSPVYNGQVEPITLTDTYGEVNVYMLPFIKPALVRRFFPDAKIETYNDAIKYAIQQMQMDVSKRNVLMTHQFVTGASRSDSEEISVGGTDNVDVTVFEGFDYVALGHIHNPQNITKNTIRYCGTPLKYSFSEVGHEKSVTIIELLEKGNINVRTTPLVPLHDMREIKGSFAEVTDKAFYENIPTSDYMHIILTDEEDIPDGIGKLRVLYPNIMHLSYDNTRTRTESHIDADEQACQKSPFELFSDFYEKQNGKSLSTEQTDFVKLLIENIWEDEQ